MGLKYNFAIVFVPLKHKINSAFSPDPKMSEESNKRRDEIFIALESVLPNACKYKLAVPPEMALYYLRAMSLGTKAMRAYTTGPLEATQPQRLTWGQMLKAAENGA